MEKFSFVKKLMWKTPLAVYSIIIRDELLGKGIGQAGQEL